MKFERDGWSIVYDRAERDDGSLFFPERLSKEVLAEKRKSVGSYVYTNQYLNKIIPSDKQTFRKEWLKYYDSLPLVKYTFAFVDPAISELDGADYTATTIVDIDTDGTWFVRVAKRARLTATETVALLFKIHETFRPMTIGVEDVAYQKAILHFAHEEMRRRQRKGIPNAVIPLAGIKRGPDKSKETRIRSLVPRFEWGHIFLNRGLDDFESEYLRFPRASHDDILDALASIEDIAITPQKPRETRNVPKPNQEGYEQHFIQQLATGRGRRR